MKELIGQEIWLVMTSPHDGPTRSTDFKRAFTKLEDARKHGAEYLGGFGNPVYIMNVILYDQDITQRDDLSGDAAEA